MACKKGFMKSARIAPALKENFKTQAYSKEKAKGRHHPKNNRTFFAKTLRLRQLPLMVF
jgi:hypothetical protein